MSGTNSTRGRTIRIFLADGSPSGILTAEIINWTGKVIVAPRTRLPDLIARTEAGQTGVYFLTGPDPEEDNRTIIYVGESNSVKERLASHNGDPTKDFFTHVCIVVSKDENLTKTHVQYLESRLISLIKLANRAKLTNSTAPVVNRLPESDRADMEFFLEQIGVVLPVLGYDFTQAPPVPSVALKPAPAVQQTRFEMATVGVRAEAVEVDGKFVVLKGSTARLDGTASWTQYPVYKTLRERLRSDQKLLEGDQPNILTFAEDVAFDSPSAAATVVYAGNANGRTSWKVQTTGQTYKDWQASQIDPSVGSDAEPP